MDGWVGHGGWPIADGLTTKWSPVYALKTTMASLNCSSNRCWMEIEPMEVAQYQRDVVKLSSAGHNAKCLNLVPSGASSADHRQCCTAGCYSSPASRRLLTNAWTNVLATSKVSDDQSDRTCRNWKKQDRENDATLTVNQDAKIWHSWERDFSRQ